LGPVTANEGRAGTLGEILERAFAIFGRRWPALCAIFALAAIPTVLLQAAVEPSFVRLVDAANALFTAGSVDAAGRARLLADLNAAFATAGGPVLADLLAQYAVLLLAQTAAFCDLSRALDGAPQPIAASYFEAVRRWPAQVLVSVAFVVLSWVLALALLPFAAAGVVLEVAVASRATAAIVGLIVTAVVGGTCLFAVALGYLAWLTATAAVAAGDVPALAAVRAGLKRTLEAPARRRTFVLAPLLVAANWSWSLAVAALAGGAVAATHAGAFAFAIPALGGIALDALRSAVIAVYARDVRLRREGADLLLAAAAAPGDGPPGDDGLDASDRALIAAFLERRATFDAAAGAAIAARIAARVRPKLRASFHYLDDVALLEHLDRSRG
jgi:hypothetical protein